MRGDRVVKLLCTCLNLGETSVVVSSEQTKCIQYYTTTTTKIIHHKMHSKYSDGNNSNDRVLVTVTLM